MPDLLALTGGLLIAAGLAQLPVIGPAAALVWLGIACLALVRYGEH